MTSVGRFVYWKHSSKVMVGVAVLIGVLWLVSVIANWRVPDWIYLVVLVPDALVVGYWMALLDHGLARLGGRDPGSQLPARAGDRSLTKE